MLRKAVVFEQPDPNGESGGDNIQPNGIEELFGPVRPEDERTGYGDDDSGSKSTENKASVIPAATGRTKMSTSRHALVKKVADIFQAVVAKGKISYYAPHASAEVPKELKSDMKVEKYPEDFNRMVQEWSDLREKTEGFEANNERIAAAQEELNKIVAEEKDRAGLESKRKRINELSTAILERAKGLDEGLGRVGRDYVLLIESKVSEASVAKAALDKIKIRVPAMAKLIEETIKEEIEALKALERDVKVIAEESVKNKQLEDSERSKKEKSKPKREKSPARSDIQNAWVVTAAETLSDAIRGLEETEQGLAEILENLDEADSTIQGWSQETTVMDDLIGEHGDDLEEGEEEGEGEGEAAPTDEVMKDESPADEEEEGSGGSWLDRFMPSAPQMQLAPMPAAQSDEALAREAKAFPSEHDQSGNLLEVVEADGKKQLVVKKDVRTKITQRVNDHFAGAFAANERVCVDFGDYIANAIVAKYRGDGRYDVKLEDGRTMDVSRDCIFSALNATNLWGE